MKLVDTSSWVEYLRGRESEAGDNVEVLFLNGAAAWCDMTLVELWHSVRGAKEKRELEEMEKEVERIPVDATVWRLASRLALRCREKGITVPTSDIVIAACAVVHGLELEHCDKHFDELMPLAKSL
ncbi:MAG TPA: PIN domain-containing protein [Candidatus Acidoferrales bacterium]|jgi:predicted nucleic acid-binding protein|nr:PIN domain-containing protein [Candidatus Acidoferrales bacterium]